MIIESIQYWVLFCEVKNMEKFDLQLFGGRGASAKSGGGGSGSNKGGGAGDIAEINTKFTQKQLDGMSRSQLEDVARAVYIKQNMARGLSASEALRRANALMDGNTTAQLKKFIKKRG